MRNIRNFILIVGVIGIVAALFNADTVLAVDGATQTENFIKNIVKTLVGVAGAVAAQHAALEVAGLSKCLHDCGVVGRHFLRGSRCGRAQQHDHA